MQKNRTNVVIRWILFIILVYWDTIKQYYLPFPFLVWFTRITMASNSECEKIHHVVKFAFSAFRTEGDKWFATCKKCNATMTEKRQLLYFWIYKVSYTRVYITIP